jgi:hypothetical protein
MLPRTDEDFDAALDEFDRIFRRIPPQRGLITTWAVDSSEPRDSSGTLTAARRSVLSNASTIRVRHAARR